MKIAKYILLILTSILLLNAISWLFIGKEKALELSLNYYEEFYSGSDTDTLFVYSKYILENEDGKVVYEYDDYGNFKERTKASFLSKLKIKSNAQNVKFVDTTTTLFSHYEPGLLNFHMDFEYRYPFYLYISSGVAVYGFGAIHEQNYLWFFKWWPIGEAGGGIS